MLAQEKKSCDALNVTNVNNCNKDDLLKSEAKIKKLQEQLKQVCGEVSFVGWLVMNDDDERGGKVANFVVVFKVVSSVGLFRESLLCGLRGMDLYIVEIFCIFDDNEEEKSEVRVEGFRERGTG